MISTVIASIGFVFALTAFIAGIRMARIFDKKAEAAMHRVNGYIALFFVVLLALYSLKDNAGYGTILLWGLCVALHLVKIYLLRKKLAFRYGGYVGTLIVISWMIVVFNHLPA